MAPQRAPATAMLGICPDCDSRAMVYALRSGAPRRCSRCRTECSSAAELDGQAGPLPVQPAMTSAACQPGAISSWATRCRRRARRPSFIPRSVRHGTACAVQSARERSRSPGVGRCGLPPMASPLTGHSLVPL